MKLPDLRRFDDCGMRAWSGAADALQSHVAQADLRHAHVDLAKARDRATLFQELDSALALPAQAQVLLQNKPKAVQYQDLDLDTFQVISDWYHYAILSALELPGEDPRDTKP